MQRLDLDHIRSFFPALDKEWTYFDNAGGTQTAVQVSDRISDYLLNTNVQLGASYEISNQSGKRVLEAQQAWAEMINADDHSEVILGSSTTQLLRNLSKSLVQLFQPGDEVIVTNCDHEANIGPWIEMEKQGIIIKTWEINTDSLQLDLMDLETLMTDKTRLVAFTHVSNILGTINPVKEFTEFIHNKGAMVCVDGVAYAPHRLIDVKELGVDFYVFSMYKVYGPHYSLLFGRKVILEKLPGINHYFIGKEEVPYKLQPGNLNYELSYGLIGIIDYFKSVYEKSFSEHDRERRTKIALLFDLFAKHEEDLGKPLINFLQSKSNVKIIGESSADRMVRVPTISFIVRDTKSSDITRKVDPYQIGIRYGDFYARRLIEALGFDKQDGVVRVSMVHYNTLEEVDRLIEILDEII